jgi:hypothetical protein
MLPSSTFVVLELAGQRIDEIARRIRRGHVELTRPAAGVSDENDEAAGPPFWTPV